MFEKARLPNEVLGQIWSLADVEQRGALNLTEFIIAMHLLTSMRGGALRALPQTLPPGLYEAASRRGPAPAPVTAIPRQFTGPMAVRPQSPLARPPQTPPVAFQTTGNDWLVTPQDKAKYDSIFATIDKSGLGYITGEQAVQFFSNSGLSEDALASIWDLADIRSEGQLNKDEFAVAMYLIKEQRTKTGSSRESIPTSLPPKLMPPSLRQRVIPPPQSTAPAFDNSAFAPEEQSNSHANDLFGLDALAGPSPPPQQPQQPSMVPQERSVPTQAPPALAASSPFMSSTQSSPQTPQQTAFKPFMPTSTFGQGLTVQHTGSSIQAPANQARAIPPQASRGGDDLLGDTDPETNSKLTSETTELANMSNQIGILRTQMQEVQTKKDTASRDISATSNQKRELEGRLGAFRNQYEQEVRDVKMLEERLNTIRNDTKRLQTEMSMIQGTHGDLQNQHRQLTEQLGADQQENTNLKQQTQQMNSEIAQLRPQLEQMQKDARQQKGMVAINKKQLATVEVEREKIRKEMADLEQERVEAERLEKERIEQERVLQQERAQADQLREQQRLEQQRMRRERLQREHDQQAERARIELEQAEKELMEMQTGQRGLAPQAEHEHASSTVASPLASPSTNPFFRRSPEPSMGGTMSPGVFSQSFGAAQPAHPSTDFDDIFGSNDNNNEADAGAQPSSEALKDMESSNMSVPAVSEPPAPPLAQQINSSALPFRADLARSDSFGSSVRAQPPASRSGMSNIGTPPQVPGSGAASVNGDIDTPAEHDRSLTGQSSPAAPHNQPDIHHPQPVSHSAQSMPGAFPDSMPGAFPDADHSRTSTPVTGVSAGFNDTSPAAQAMHRVSLDQASQPASSGPSRSTSEFPPIQELDVDDSDSDDDDHSFGTASGHPPAGHSPATMLTEPTHSNSTAFAESSSEIPAAQPSVAELVEDDSVREQPPPLEAQKSPPTYNDASPTSPNGHQNPNEFPKEYTGLLPSREPVTSPISEPIQQTPQSIVTSFDSHGPGSLPSTTYSIAGSNAQEKPFPGTNGFPHLESVGQHTAASTTAQAPVDDFDADFDDLDEAQVEEDEHTQDSFVSTGARGAEFDPAFDSPRSAQAGTTSFGSSSQFPQPASSSSNINGASTSATSYQPSYMPWMNNSAALAPATTALNFGGGTPSVASASQAPTSQAPKPQTRTYGPAPPPRQGPPAQSSGSNTDWDSMFSGFDNAPTAKAAVQPLSQPKASSYGFDDDEITSAPVQPLARTTTNSSIRSPSVRSPAPPPSSYRPPQQRPAPVGRALTTTGEHDDPFLKNLTGMGFERGAALNALEKFDYDIDRVS